jgi:hypothetical protein
MDELPPPAFSPTSRTCASARGIKTRKMEAAASSGRTIRYIISVLNIVNFWWVVGDYVLQTRTYKVAVS